MASMKIIVHRGTKQIGGCATEISTEKTRVLIDFGMQLPNLYGENAKDNLKIEGVNKGLNRCDAIFFTHYHGDHIGLMSEVNPEIPMYIGALAKEIYLCLNKTLYKSEISMIEKLNTYRPIVPIKIGDLSITPIPTDHSACDAYMLLIEGDGKKVLHTGDFRLHGFTKERILAHLEKYVGKVDVLITEGTLFSRNDMSILSEYAIQDELKQIIEENKYVFVLCSSTNIDRLAMLHNNTPPGKYFICDAYQKEVFNIVAKARESSYYQFNKALTYGSNLPIREKGFVMAVRCNEWFKKMIAEYKDEATLIYSMWIGYVGEGVKDTKLKEFIGDYIQSGRMRVLHTSGHATKEAIGKVCEVVKPQYIIPIHTEQPEVAKELGMNITVKLLNDEEVFEL